MGSNNPPRVCNTGLELSLGSEHHTTLCHDHDVDVLDDRQENNKKKSIITSLKYDHLLPSDLTLGPMMINDSTPSDDRDQKSPDRVLHSQASSLSAVSSFSNSSASTTVVIKRDRDVISSEEAETDLERSVLLTTRVINDSINGNNTNNNQEDDQDQGSPRKKLRLTKQQSALLEDSFKEHTTLNPKQKQDLAIELNLRPRQVEVWFQNRRARTKLKQTEADYEQWKKCCETLTEENKRLQKELQELRSLRLITTPFYTPFATSPQVICPSCQRLGASAGANKPAHLISASFTASNQHYSAAC